MIPVNISVRSRSGGRQRDLIAVDMITVGMSRFPRSECEKRPQGTKRRGRKATRRLSSFIRTMTVGSGIGPDLLTLRRSLSRRWPEALAGSSAARGA